jgi:hypothetical protein
MKRPSSSAFFWTVHSFTAIAVAVIHCQQQLPTLKTTMALAADEGWTKSQLMGGVEESAIATKKGKVRMFSWATNL